MTARFFAHSFDSAGEYWSVLDAHGKIVSKHTDMTCCDAHRLADEMNDELDANARERLERIANNPSLIPRAGAEPCTIAPEHVTPCATPAARDGVPGPNSEFDSRDGGQEPFPGFAWHGG